jgi:hypothetical protein
VLNADLTIQHTIVRLLLRVKLCLVCNSKNVAFRILSYSMELSPSCEDNRFVANQEIPRVLLNPKVHYRIHKCLPPVSILNQPNPVHTPTSHFLKSHPNIISHLRLGLPRFPHQNPIHASLLLIRATCPTHHGLKHVTFIY